MNTLFETKSEMHEYARSIDLKGRSKIFDLNDLIALMKKDYPLESKLIKKCNSRIINHYKGTCRKLDKLETIPKKPLKGKGNSRMEVTLTYIKYFKFHIPNDHISTIRRGYPQGYDQTIISEESGTLINHYYSNLWKIRNEFEDYLNSIKYQRMKKLESLERDWV